MEVGTPPPAIGGASEPTELRQQISKNLAIRLFAFIQALLNTLGSFCDPVADTADVFAKPSDGPAADQGTEHNRTDGHQ